MLGEIFSAVGNMFGMASENKWANKNLDFQKDAAQKAIQWRVKDAQAAGIHPLYAMGNPGVGGSPVSNDAGVFASQMGQDLGRAAASMMTRKERQRAAATAATREAIQFDQDTQRRELENQYLRAQIAKLSNDQVPPAAPDGAGLGVQDSGAPVGAVTPRPSQPIVGSRDSAARQPGAITDVQFFRRMDGGIGITYSEEMKDRAEDDLVEQGLWMWRNRGLPFISGRAPPVGPSTRDFPLPGRLMWRWDGSRQAYFPYNPATNRWADGRRIN